MLRVAAIQSVLCAGTDGVAESGGGSVRLSLSQYLSLSMRAEQERCLEDHLLLGT